MTTTNTNQTTAQTTESTVAQTQPVKRGRGRPKGSRNKPKDPNAPTPVKRSVGRPRKDVNVVASVPSEVGFQDLT